MPWGNELISAAISRNTDVTTSGIKTWRLRQGCKLAFVSHSGLNIGSTVGRWLIVFELQSCRIRFVVVICLRWWSSFSFFVIWSICRPIRSPLLLRRSSCPYTWKTMQQAGGPRTIDANILVGPYRKYTKYHTISLMNDEALSYSTLHNVQRYLYNICFWTVQTAFEQVASTAFSN